MKRSFFGIVVLSQVILSGCILLPFPHEQWLSPRFSGEIVDGHSRVPLEGVKVTLSDFRIGERSVHDVNTVSDASGHYVILATRHSNWVGMMLGPADPAVDVSHLKFEISGYQSVEEQKQWIVRGRQEFQINVSMQKEKPNQALEPTTTAVTHRAPSSTLRASRGRGSP
jgi:hypothetical protein